MWNCQVLNLHRYTQGDETRGNYALGILKNRLAKGEITIEEFKVLKDALSEP
ncbi:SHOCT domain-containing protein [Candidatus Nitrosotalea sp. TS]|uniref:SHOCT domain-containing protein n=1 Tax=Candidatus Nitrosotalea sp. TS TaxID=2341020 RepID=UPI00140A759F